MPAQYIKSATSQSLQFALSTLAWRHDQPQKACRRSQRGKARAERQRQRCAVMSGDAEAQSGKRGPGGLSDQPRCRHNAARASGATRWRAGHDCLHVRGLEKTEADAAQRDAPDNVWDARIIRQIGQQRHADREHGEAAAAERAGVMAIRQAAGDRRHHRDHQRPGRDENPVSTCERCSTSSK